VLGFINIYFECIRTTILDVYSNIIIIINDLDIMVTLNGIYYEYIKIVHKIFVKYIVPIIQVYPNHFITLKKLLQMTFIIIIIIIILHQ